MKSKRRKPCIAKERCHALRERDPFLARKWTMNRMEKEFMYHVKEFMLCKWRNPCIIRERCHLMQGNKFIHSKKIMHSKTRMSCIAREGVMDYRREIYPWREDNIKRIIKDDINRSVNNNIENIINISHQPFYCFDKEESLNIIFQIWDTRFICFTSNQRSWSQMFKGSK